MNPIRRLHARRSRILAAILSGVSLAPLPDAASHRADAERTRLKPCSQSWIAANQLQLKTLRNRSYPVRIEEIDNFETKAQFGATTGSSAVMAACARDGACGDYKTTARAVKRRRNPLAALDDDAIAMRTALWLATDQRIRTLWRLMRKSRPPQAG